MMTIDGIILLCTTIVTYIFAEISKKVEIDASLIPFQNFTIGVLAGIIVYIAKLNDNVFTSILICLIASMGAGGTYDLVKTKDDENGDK